MSDVHSTRRYERYDDEESKPIKPASVAPASSSLQSAWDVEDRRKLWQQVTNLGKELEGNRTSSIVTAFSFAFVVCVAMISLIWRQGANFDERLAAQQKFNEAYKNAIDRQLELIASENLYAMAKQAQEVHLALERATADAENNRKTIAELRVKLAEMPKHLDVVVQDSPEQKTEKIANDLTWPPKPSTLAELRQYDGETVRLPMQVKHLNGITVQSIVVNHLPYAYGKRISVHLFLSAEDYALAKNWRRVDVQALEDAHRNR